MKGGGPGARITKIKSYTQEVTVASANLAKDICDLYIVAILVDIQPPLAAVRTGNLLNIEAVSGGRIAALDASEQICGHLATMLDSKLLNCLSLGNKYRGRLQHDRISIAVQKMR